MRALGGICECGCGAALPTRTGHFERGPKRFANGHNRRKSVVYFCGERQVPVYVHDGRGWCSGCHRWVSVVLAHA